MAAATGGDLSRLINLAYVSGSWHGVRARSACVSARGFCEIRRHTHTQQLLGREKPQTELSAPGEFSATFARAEKIAARIRHGLFQLCWMETQYYTEAGI